MNMKQLATALACALAFGASADDGNNNKVATSGAAPAVVGAAGGVLDGRGGFGKLLAVARREDSSRGATILLAASGAPTRCEIPGYPDSVGDFSKIGLSWCPAEVDFQVRSLALNAAGAWCAVLSEMAAGEQTIAHLHKQIRDSCNLLDGMEERRRQGAGGFGAPRRHLACRCPAGYRP